MIAGVCTQDLSSRFLQYQGASVEEVPTFSVFIRHRAGEFGGGRGRLRGEMDHGDDVVASARRAGDENRTMG